MKGTAKKIILSGMFFLYIIVGYSMPISKIKQDSSSCKKIDWGFAIPYSIVSNANFYSVSKQSSAGGTKFFTGISVFAKYDYSKTIALQFGTSIEVGEYTRFLPDDNTKQYPFIHFFREIQIPSFSVIYLFNKHNKPNSFFMSVGYSLDFILNHFWNQTKQQDGQNFVYGSNEVLQLSNSYFNSSVFTQVGIINHKQKKYYIAINAYYSTYWKDYYGMTIGIYL
ncbi:MAG: hypothetical protein ABIZ51_09860 [Bacteroidia bacterium]